MATEDAARVTAARLLLEEEKRERAKLEQRFAEERANLERRVLLEEGKMAEAQRQVEELQAEGVDYVDTDDLDRYMMRQFDDWCYKERSGASKGNVLFDAMIGCFPSFNGSFPRANRCLKAWRKVRPPGERGPMPLEAVWFGAMKLLRMGMVLEAWVILVSVGC